MSSEAFVGTWQLTAYEERLDDGTVIYPLGKDAAGRLMYDEDGRFAAQLMKAGRPSFASGGVYGGTAEETEAAYNGYLAYFGSYEVDVDHHNMLHHVEASLFPNWIGVKQVRAYEFQGENAMSLTTPPLDVAGKKGVSILAWKRAKS
jgi:hypothetical protein